MVNANVFIASGVLLLALAAGVFLLAKASKDNLGPIYKIVAWIIIIGSIVNAGSNAMNCMFKLYHKHMMGHEMKMDHEMKMNPMFMHHKMWSHSGSCREGCEGQCRQGMMCAGGGCCNQEMMSGGGMCRPDNQGYWKKCYEELKDSCSRSRVK